MFYSTRHFFKLAGFLLAACLACQRFPDMLRGLKNVWGALERFLSAHALSAGFSLLLDGFSRVMQGIK
jgi:hypothetical protein